MLDIAVCITTTQFKLRYILDSTEWIQSIHNFEIDTLGFYHNSHYKLKMKLWGRTYFWTWVITPNKALVLDDILEFLERWIQSLQIFPSTSKKSPAAETIFVLNNPHKIYMYARNFKNYLSKILYSQLLLLQLLFVFELSYTHR